MSLIITIIRAIYRYYFRVGWNWLLFNHAVTAAFVLLLWIAGRKRLKRWRRVTADLFFFYMITVLTSTVLSRSSGSEALYNLDLFWSYREIFSGQGDSWLTTAENIILFVPFGMLVPNLIPKRGRAAATVLLGLSFSMLIEGLQLGLRKGLFELDDIVNNVIGVIVGYVVWAAVQAVWLRR